jgi:hypothetical protein
VEVHLDPHLRWHVHRGEEEPVLGWYSPSFGERVPAISLIGRGAISDSGVVRCLLLLEPAA